MGHTLSSPKTGKLTEFKYSKYLSYGSSCMQGFRISMEDQHNHFLPEDMRAILKKHSKQESKSDLSFFGIYDGHSGDGCPKFLSENLIGTLLEKESGPDYFANDDDIKQAYMRADTKFLEEVVKKTTDTSGSTCTSIFIKQDGDSVEIICPNIGDSRTILNNGSKTIALSNDHKPTDPNERARINDAGFAVQMGRVDGVLALSRAFGDFRYKENTQKSQAEQAVSVCPDITRTTIKLNSKETGGFQFVVLACDGVWDVMTNDQVSQFVTQRIQEQLKGTYKKARMVRARADVTDNPCMENKQAYLEELQEKTDKVNTLSPQAIAEDLIDHSVIKLDSKDNVSAIVVLFHSGELTDVKEDAF